MSETSEAEVDRMVGLANDIADLLEREPDGILRLSAIATVLKVQAFIISSADQPVALQHIEAVGEIARGALLEDWEDFLAVRRKGAH